MKTKVRIYWRTETGCEGHGSPITRDIAKDWIRMLTNEPNYNIEYWLEPA